MDSESSDRELTGPTLDGSTVLNTSEVQPSEKKECEETVVGPVAPTQGGDDYPDGGVTAWCVVLGVSKLNNPLAFSDLLTRVRSCSLRVLISRRRLHSTSLVSNS